MMSEVQNTTLSTDNPSVKSCGHSNLFSDACNLFPSSKRKVNECIALHYKPLNKDDSVTTSVFPIWINKDSSTMESNSERQLHAWKDNPYWIDHPPKIKVTKPRHCGSVWIKGFEERFASYTHNYINVAHVTIPKGSLSNLSLQVDVGLPPDAVYNVVTDPDNKRVFKNIKEVKSRKILVDEGLRQVVEVEQAAIWRFLWWSGTISVHVLVDQNRENYTVRT
ncbi:hypothetical protein OROHE_002725 [Orobanche hederae]